MGKQNVASRAAHKTGKTSTLFSLTLPTDLLEAADNERRKALSVLCKSTPMYQMPPVGTAFSSWPPIVVPKADLAAFAAGKSFTPTLVFVFFRKFLLLLVCNEDLLTSFVDSGGKTMKGTDVRDKWHGALTSVVSYTLERAKAQQPPPPPAEQQQLLSLLHALKTGLDARAIVWRARFRMLAEGGVSVGIPLALAWCMGYWTFSDVSDTLAAFFGTGRDANADYDVPYGSWQ